MALNSGYVIKLGVTHQCTIDGENSWIKLEIESVVQENEDAEQAFKRVNKELQSRVISAMESSAQTIMDYTKKG